jgi:dynein heavy chain
MSVCISQAIKFLSFSYSVAIIVWVEGVSNAYTGLQASVLVRDPESKEIKSNFDPKIYELLQETRKMFELKLELPEIAHTLTIIEPRLKKHQAFVAQMIGDYKSSVASIPEKVSALLTPALRKVDAVMEVGLSSLSWTSVNLDTYVKNVSDKLEEFKTLLAKVNDILEIRIYGVLQSIRETQLCQLPNKTAWTVSQYLSEVEHVCTKEAQDIERKSALIEVAVKELIDLLLSKMDEAQRTSPEIIEATKEFTAFCNHSNADALLKSTRSTLDAIKKRLTTRVQGYDEKQVEPAKPPFFSAQVSLNIPNIVMVPALDDIQQALNKSVAMILGVSKSVYVWGQDRSLDASQLKNYYLQISENKDITKFTGTMSSAINFTKKEITDVLDGLTVHNKIWKVCCFNWPVAIFFPHLHHLNAIFAFRMTVRKKSKCFWRAIPTCLPLRRPSKTTRPLRRM